MLATDAVDLDHSVPASQGGIGDRILQSIPRNSVAAPL
jgi:hypothetical protein